jgi:GNAT superfamily N-acetyltransferase
MRAKAERATIDPNTSGVTGNSTNHEHTFRRMISTDRPDAFALLSTFLREDEHYLASSAAYGDGGAEALGAALALYDERPDYGFVWMAFEDERACGCCTVSYAISTSAGAVVARLDDAVVLPRLRGRGIGHAMLEALFAELRRAHFARVDLAVHRRNTGARRLYERLGFAPLDEERLALLL